MRGLHKIFLITDPPKFKRKSPTALVKSYQCRSISKSKRGDDSITSETLPQDLLDAFNAVDTGFKAQDLRKLKEHGAFILDSIKPTIGGIHIERADAFLQLLEASENSSFVFVQGERGCGKWTSCESSS